MPRIFDNIEKQLLPALRETIEVADHADFCVGYFNLRGWKEIDSLIERWANWFQDRWNDRWCLDISDELADIISESWAREEPIPPYHIYIKMAYHLSHEARAGLVEFRIPKVFQDKLLDFQTAAVKIAAHHLNKRGGVLIGDVVGLGKTLMAAALARIFEDDHGLETLILCPKNLVPMWEDYVAQYGLRAKVLSISRVIRELPNLRRYRVVLIDESQNLRNREGKRYRAIHEYIQENESKCILLSATPYNKTCLDLSNQLRLFVPDEKNLGIRPEALIRELGEPEFIRMHQCAVHSLAAFEKSLHPDDWRELMRLYMVRRTRGFIKENYAQTDEANGRKYLTFHDGSRSYFPTRDPQTVKFKIDDSNPDDQYARLFSPTVVDIINHLNLPRYGLGNYLAAAPHQPPTQAEAKLIQDLSRAGKRLMGFCRTNLYKRLESSGEAFLQSVEWHILRNFVYIHAIEKGQPIPIGTQDREMLDSRSYDEDADAEDLIPGLFDDDDNSDEIESPITGRLAPRSDQDFRQKAAEAYTRYATQHKSRFRWLRPDLFVNSLAKDLHTDSAALLKVLAGKLFEGLEHCRSVIFLSQARHSQRSHVLATTRYQRWPTATREALFALLQFTLVGTEPLYPGIFPKYAHSSVEAIFNKIKAARAQPVAAVVAKRSTSDFIFYQESTGYWVKASVSLPYYSNNGRTGTPPHGRFLYLDRLDTLHPVCAVLNSSLFYLYFIVFGDCFHLSDRLVAGMPMTPALLTSQSLLQLNRRLMKDLQARAVRKTINTKTGDKISYDEYYAWKSKPLIDEIDRVLAKHYGFTDEELDFIINYDIKYRMGREAEGAEA